MTKAGAVRYEGRELEAMSLARRYRRWVLEEFRPYVGERIVEVGAGTGLFSSLLAELAPERLMLVEPSREMFSLLRSSPVAGNPCTELHNDAVAGVIRELGGSRPTSLIYVNVLEHVLDDECELRMMAEILSPGGRICVFVPALPSLYSAFDRRIGHYRRYRRRELKAKVERAGFTVVKLRNFDSLGVVTWWLTFKLLRRTRMRPLAVHAYDRLIVPVLRRLERLARPPFGKSLVLVAEKPRLDENGLGRGTTTPSDLQSERLR